MGKERTKIAGLLISGIISISIGLYLIGYLRQLDSPDSFKQYKFSLKYRSPVIRVRNPITIYQDFFSNDLPWVPFRLNFTELDDNSWDRIDKSIKIGDTITVILLSKDYETAMLNRHIGCIDVFGLSKDNAVFLPFNDKINSEKRITNISIYSIIFIGSLLIILGFWKLKEKN